MIDQKLRINSKHLIQKIFIINICGCANGTLGNIAHCIQSCCFQLFRISSSHAPEIRQRAMIPQLIPIRLLVQFCDSHTICIRFGMLCANIHSNFTQIQIRSDSRRRCNPSLFVHTLNHFCCQLPRCLFVYMQIMGNIKKHLVNGIDMHIFRRNILHINLVDPCAVFHI